MKRTESRKLQSKKRAFKQSSVPVYLDIDFEVRAVSISRSGVVATTLYHSAVCVDALPQIQTVCLVLLAREISVEHTTARSKVQERKNMCWCTSLAD